MEKKVDEAGEEKVREEEESVERSEDGDGVDPMEGDFTNGNGENGNEGKLIV